MRLNKVFLDCICFVLVFVLVICMSSVAYAKNTTQAKKGWYIGFLYNYNNVRDDFDDKSVLYTSFEIFDVPKLKNGSGTGFVLGHRVDSAAIEFSYFNTKHDTTSLLMGDSEATYNVINLDVKGYFRKKGKLQPYFLIGLAFPWLEIDNSSFNANGDIGDETFTGGRGLNIGGGLAYYFTQKWSIFGSIFYRYGSFGKIEGIDIEDRLGHSGYTSTAGITYTF